MLSEGASEEEIAKVRIDPAEKKKMFEKFSQDRKSGIIEENVSVNMDTGDITGALLTGDSNEELRQADRLAEKATNAKEGKMKRVTIEDIRASQRSPANAAASPHVSGGIDDMMLLNPPERSMTRRRTTKLGLNTTV